MAYPSHRLIEKIHSLPPDQLAEVEDFVDFLRERRGRRGPETLPVALADEATLLAVIKRASKIPNRKQYLELVRKRQTGMLTEAELRELIERTEHIEQNTTERTAALAQLAELLQVSLAEVMRQLG